MVNTVGLDKVDVLSALGKAARCAWEPVRPYKQAWNPIPNCWCAMIDEIFVMVDLRADDGFDESSYDRACGQGAAQRAINQLKIEHYPYRGRRKFPTDEDLGNEMFYMPCCIRREGQ